MTYETYIKQMKEFKKAPMSEKQFNSMMGIETDKCAPALQIRRNRNSKKVDATHKNYEVADGK